MKKVISFLLIVLMSVTFASCKPALDDNADDGSVRSPGTSVVVGEEKTSTASESVSGTTVEGTTADGGAYYTAGSVKCGCGATLVEMTRHGAAGAPGELPVYKDLPDADTAGVGEVTDVKVDTACGALGGVYRRDPVSGKERLIIWRNHNRGADTLRPVEIYETSFGGEKEFMRAAEDGSTFKAKLLGRMFFIMTVDGSYAPTKEYHEGAVLIEKADDSAGGTVFVSVRYKNGVRECTLSRPDGSGGGFGEFISSELERAGKRYPAAALASVDG